MSQRRPRRVILVLGVAAAVVTAAMGISLVVRSQSRDSVGATSSGPGIDCPVAAIEMYTDLTDSRPRRTVGFLDSDCGVTEVPGAEDNDSGALSPSGDRIASVESSGRGSRIVLRATDGSDAQTVFENRKTVFDLAWSPDGKKLAFWYETGIRSVVYVLDLKSRAIRRLSSPFVTSIQPAWDASGEHIAVLRKRQVDVYNTVGGGVRTLRTQEPVLEMTWSPDGSQMALLGPPVDSRSGGGVPVGGRVTVADLDGKGTGGSYLVEDGVLDLGWDDGGVIVATSLDAFETMLTRLKTPGLDVATGSAVVTGVPDLN